MCDSVASTIDVMPTVVGLTGATAPQKPLDGIDIWPLLTGQKKELDREAFLYFDNLYLQCARRGRYKLHISRYNSFVYSPPPLDGRTNLPLKPELYDVVNDPEESYDIAPEHPEIVADLQARIERLMQTFPEDIRTAYSSTMIKPVAPTAAGALPVPRKQ